MRVPTDIQLNSTLRRLLVFSSVLLLLTGPPIWLFERTARHWEDAREIVFRRDALNRVLRAPSPSDPIADSETKRLLLPDDARPVQVAKLQAKLQEYAASSGVIALSATETTAQADMPSVSAIAIKMEVSGTLSSQLAFLTLIESSTPWLHVQSVAFRSSEVPGMTTATEAIINGNIEIWAAIRHANPVPLLQGSVQ